MNEYNLRFKIAFDSLNISQEKFIEEFNSSGQSSIPLTQSRLSIMLSGKTYVPIDVIDYLCSGDEPYNMNIDYFILKSDKLFKIKEEVKQTAKEVKSLWSKIMGYFVILIVMCLSITTQAQILIPNQRVIKKEFTYFMVEGDSSFIKLDSPRTIVFTHIDGLYYQYVGNDKVEEIPYSLVLDSERNTTSFINEYNIFTWYKKDGEVYLKQYILWGDYQGMVILFK